MIPYLLKSSVIKAELHSQENLLIYLFEKFGTDMTMHPPICLLSIHPHHKESNVKCRMLML